MRISSRVRPAVPRAKAPEPKVITTLAPVVTDVAPIVTTGRPLPILTTTEKPQKPQKVKSKLLYDSHYEYGKKYYF